MKPNNYFPKHSSKLKFEALLRAFLCGLAVGFSAAFVAAFATWLTVIDGVWLILTALAAATAVATPIFYFARFRPTAISSARRIDTLGLEERLVTMVEYKDDPSVIAKLQREDAKAALARASAKYLKITISNAVVVSLIICAYLFAGMTTVNILAEKGIIQGGDDLVNNFVEEQTTEWVSVSYIIEEGGTLEGDEEQMIVKGTNASTVTAVADDGYVFKEWSDGSAFPTREDREINADIVYVAIFTPLQDGDSGEDGDPGEDGEEGDEGDDSDAPGEEGDEGEQGEQQQPQPGDQEPNPGAGGKYEAHNQIIDGNKFYRDELDGKYREDALDLLEDENSGLSDAEKELIKKYFGIV